MQEFSVSIQLQLKIFSRIQIEYETNPESPALIWLNAEQTADGKHPFMLSNNKVTGNK